MIAEPPPKSTTLARNVEQRCLQMDGWDAWDVPLAVAASTDGGREGGERAGTCSRQVRFNSGYLRYAMPPRYRHRGRAGWGPAAPRASERAPPRFLSALNYSKKVWASLLHRRRDAAGGAAPKRARVPEARGLYLCTSPKQDSSQKPRLTRTKLSLKVKSNSLTHL